MISLHISLFCPGQNCHCHLPYLGMVGLPGLLLSVRYIPVHGPTAEIMGGYRVFSREKKRRGMCHSGEVL